MEVRAATRVDADAVLALMDALVQEDGGRHDPAANLGWVREHGQAEIVDRLGRDGRIDLLAEDAGSPVGLLMGGWNEPSRFSLAAIARIGSLYVAPQHRGRGVGTALLKAFFEQAQHAGARYAEVTAYAGNVDAIRFYARHGLAPAASTMRRSLDR